MKSHLIKKYLKDNRIDSDTIIIPDGLEKENTEQAF